MYSQKYPVYCAYEGQLLDFETDRLVNPDRSVYLEGVVKVYDRYSGPPTSSDLQRTLPNPVFTVSGSDVAGEESYTLLVTTDDDRALLIHFPDDQYLVTFVDDPEDEEIDDEI